MKKCCNHDCNQGRTCPLNKEQSITELFQKLIGLISINMNVVAILIYNLLILAGVSYLVAVLDWSVWTYLFAMFFALDYEGVKGQN